MCGGGGVTQVLPAALGSLQAERLPALCAHSREAAGAPPCHCLESRAGAVERMPPPPPPTNCPPVLHTAARRWCGGAAAAAEQGRDLDARCLLCRREGETAHTAHLGDDRKGVVCLSNPLTWHALICMLRMPSCLVALCSNHALLMHPNACSTLASLARALNFLLPALRGAVVRRVESAGGRVSARRRGRWAVMLRCRQRSRACTARSCCT